MINQASLHVEQGRPETLYVILVWVTGQLHTSLGKQEPSVAPLSGQMVEVQLSRALLTS